ncbi:MAG: RNA polymerase sigma factor region1.1 domain-containing protein [Planctomycetes bacterium]|nr:RNA polymerase sigma factor region1.1 domain-containing protein [Planctomycetota bacterium]
MIATESTDDPFEGLPIVARTLIEKGRQKGFLTFAEMQLDLEKALLSPEQIDQLLMRLEELGIELLDESETEE